MEVFKCIWSRNFVSVGAGVTNIVHMQGAERANHLLREEGPSALLLYDTSTTVHPVTSTSGGARLIESQQPKQSVFSAIASAEILKVISRYNILT